MIIGGLDAAPEWLAGVREREKERNHDRIRDEWNFAA